MIRMNTKQTISLNKLLSDVAARARRYREQAHLCRQDGEQVERSADYYEAQAEAADEEYHELVEILGNCGKKAT